MARIYLAARYSRIEEMRAFAERLEKVGHKVAARWLDGNHRLKENAPFDSQSMQFAKDDFQDVWRADVVISFTEEPRSVLTRGGRHVEFGIGLAAHGRAVVIGPRENVFHYLPWVRVYETAKAFWKQDILAKGLS